MEVDLWDELDKLGGGKSERSLRSQGTLKHLVTMVKAPRGGDRRCAKLAKGMPKAHYVLVTNAEAVRQSSKSKIKKISGTTCTKFEQVVVNQTMFPFSMLVATGDDD